MLYTSAAVRLQKGAFCYADDIAILRTGASLAESSQRLAQAFQRLSEYGASNGLPFSPKKTEVQHFSRRRR